MSNETWLQRRIKSFAGRVGYESERLILSVNEQIQSKMEAGGTTRAELAKKLGVTKAYVSRTLNGTPNMTLRTLVSVASVLGCRVSVTLTDHAVATNERPKVCDFSEFLQQRQTRGTPDGATILQGFKPFVPPAPAPEKQNAAA